MSCPSHGGIATPAAPEQPAPGRRTHLDRHTTPRWLLLDELARILSDHVNEDALAEDCDA